jgi:hypothetical protein
MTLLMQAKGRLAEELHFICVNRTQKLPLPGPQEFFLPLGIVMLMLRPEHWVCHNGSVSLVDSAMETLVTWRVTSWPNPDTYPPLVKLVPLSTRLDAPHHVAADPLNAGPWPAHTTQNTA